MSPFKALYGRSPPSVIRIGHNCTSVDSLDQLLHERDAILDDLKYHLIRAQHRMKKQADLKRRDVNFEEGDLVYLKLQPYRQQSLARRPCDKLSSRFYGPYVVIAKVGKVAYRLELPVGTKIHPVFHVSQLKRANGASFNPTDLPSQLSSTLELMVEPVAVLGVRKAPTQPWATAQVLIQWQGLPVSEATWELYGNILSLFPDFHLEDKVALVGGGIVMDPDTPKPTIKFTYSRRSK
jgi:ribosomal protein L21E